MTRLSFFCTIYLIIFCVHKGWTQFNQNPFFNTALNKQLSQQPRQQQLQPKASIGLCPEPIGRYPSSGQCDAYIECKDGVAEEKLCPDGLLFNEKLDLFQYPCSYPIDVDCKARARLQSPQATEECPHQFGYYRLGDSENCGQFKNCANGRGFILDCPEGLAFNKETYQCDWPDLVPDCDAEAFVRFTCPAEPNQSSGLGSSEIRYFPSPHDCQHYYTCINGRPRIHNCGEGNGYEELTQHCDGAENVTTCETPQAKEYHSQSQTLLPDKNPFLSKYKF